MALEPSGSEPSSTAIPQIRSGGRAQRGLAGSVLRSIVLGVAVFSGTVLVALDADAGQRVSLLGFEGDSATPIRWRVAQILKRAGHTVLGFAPPRNPDSANELRSYAKRRRVDVFVSGSSVESSSGWELTLTVRGPDGETMGGALEFTAGSLGELVKELKADGQERLDRAVEGGGATPARDVDLDGASSEAGDGTEAAWDVDGAEPPKKGAKSKKARNKKKSRRPSLERRAKDERQKVEEPLPPTSVEDEPASMDEPAVPEEESDSEKPRRKSGRLARLGRSEESSAASDSSDGDPLGGGSADDSDNAGSEEGSSEEGASADPGAALGADAAPEDDDGGKDAGDRRYATAIIGVDAGLLRRSLTYVDDIYGRQRTPRTNAWVYRVHAAFYPFARPVKDRIGVIAGYESAFSGRVRDNDVDADFAVTFSELYGGVRLRQPIGRHEIGLQGTVGTLSAGLDDPDGRSRVPEFSYKLLSPSIDVGLDFGAVGVRAAVGYKKTFGDFGEISSADYFPRMGGSGVDGKLQVEYRYSDEIALELAGSMRRFVLQMNSVPQDATDGIAEVAGGAVDQYLAGYFGLNFTL